MIYKGIWVASSHLTENIESIEKCCKNGAGGIVLKGTDGRMSQPCSRKCQQCRLVSSFGGRKLFFDKRNIYSFTPNSPLCEFLSVEEVKNILHFLRNNHPKVLRIANVSAKNPEDFIKTANLLKEYGAQLLELNSKYTVRYSDLKSDTAEEYLLNFIRKIKKAIKIPFILKICPEFGLLDERFFRDVSRCGVSGVTIANGILVNLPPSFIKELPSGIIKRTCSWVGDRLWELVKEYVPIAKNYFNFVSASGGILDSKRAKEIVGLGADSVQLCSGIEFSGYGLIDEIGKELKNS